MAISLVGGAKATPFFCKKLPYDAEFPAGLTGSYEIIGRDAQTGASYAGHLLISDGKTRYALTRTVGGRRTNGDAWVESCGPDKIQFLVVRYYSRPATDVSCRLGMDGDNYNRATCRSRAGGSDWRGLEAWFQSPVP